MIPDNAWILRITAAAGTELADPYSYSTVKLPHEGVFLPVQKQFTIHRTVILHAASAAVIRRIQALSGIIGFKGSVGGLISQW